MEIKYFIDEKQLADDLAIPDTVSISETIRKHSGMAMHYDMKHASAERQENRAKMILESVRGTIELQIRGDSLNGKITADTVKAMVANHPAYLEAYTDWIKAAEEALKAKHAAYRFSGREQLLRTLAAAELAERRGDMKVRDAPSF